MRLRLTGVGDDDESTVRTVLDDLGDDGPEDVHVPLHQVQATLALLLADTRRHHDQAGVGGHCVVWKGEEEEEILYFRAVSLTCKFSHRQKHFKI